MIIIAIMIIAIFFIISFFNLEFFDDKPVSVSKTGLSILKGDEPVKARFIRINNYDNKAFFSEIQVWDPTLSINLAANKMVSSDAGESKLLTDDNFANFIEAKFIMIDLGMEMDIGAIVIFLRNDCCQFQIIGASVELLDNNKKIVFQSYKIDTPANDFNINLLDKISLKIPSKFFEFGDKNTLDINGSWNNGAIINNMMGKLNDQSFKIKQFKKNFYSFIWNNGKANTVQALIGNNFGTAKKLLFDNGQAWFR